MRYLATEWMKLAAWQDAPNAELAARYPETPSAPAMPTGLPQEAAAGAASFGRSPMMVAPPSALSQMGMGLARAGQAAIPVAQAAGSHLATAWRAINRPDTRLGW